jgi:trk system potassium uptake protein TrkH
MNVPLLAKLLGIVSALIGVFMLFSLPWAIPGIGRHAGYFERPGFTALVISIGISFLLAGALFLYGRRATGRLFRKEAMAVVGLSWVLATVLGALPFYLSGTLRGPAIMMSEATGLPLVLSGGGQLFQVWRPSPPLAADDLAVVRTLASSNPSSIGLSAADLRRQSGITNAVAIAQRLNADAFWNKYLILPGERKSTADRASNYRIRWQTMTICDAVFESQSGFSTTGASVMSELEDPQAVASCILFWRSSTHFLGGLGIIVLFVVLLGQGSAGKALMRTEVPGPASDSFAARMQHSAWWFAGIYFGLNLLLIALLLILGMGPFDAACHTFGTMATGGFSTRNASLGHFDSAAIEYVVIVFMILAGTNFMLLYLCLLRQPLRLLTDVEFRTYIGIIVAAAAAVMISCWWNGDRGFQSAEAAFRNGLFQVVSIVTTTGFGTNDFDSWNQFGRLLLLLLMFVGGCAGSTGGGLKVIRHYLLYRLLWIELEKAYHPRLVKTLNVQGDTDIDEGELRRSLLVYVAMIGILCATSWLVIVAVEPDTTWAGATENKLIDSFSCVAATINNIGPGLGIVGPTENYGNFCGFSKLFFSFLMMLGRLEIWPILVLFAPGFWKNM